MSERRNDISRPAQDDVRLRFAARLSGLRRERKLTQAMLAERAGLSTNAIGSYERGERFPRLSALQALSDALGEGAADRLVDASLRMSEAPSRRERARSATVAKLEQLVSAQPPATQRTILKLAEMMVSELARRDLGANG